MFSKTNCESSVTNIMFRDTTRLFSILRLSSNANSHRDTRKLSYWRVKCLSAFYGLSYFSLKNINKAFALTEVQFFLRFRFVTTFLRLGCGSSEKAFAYSARNVICYIAGARVNSSLLIIS